MRLLLLIFITTILSANEYQMAQLPIPNLRDSLAHPTSVHSSIGSFGHQWDSLQNTLWLIHTQKNKLIKAQAIGNKKTNCPDPKYNCPDKLEISPAQKWIWHHNRNRFGLTLYSTDNLSEKKLKEEFIPKQSGNDRYYPEFAYGDSLISILGGCICEGQEGHSTYFEYLYFGNNFTHSWGLKGEIYAVKEKDSLLISLKRTELDAPVDTINFYHLSDHRLVKQHILKRYANTILDVKDIDTNGYTVAYIKKGNVEVRKVFKDRATLLKKIPLPPGYLHAPSCRFEGTYLILYGEQWINGKKFLIPPPQQLYPKRI